MSSISRLALCTAVLVIPAIAQATPIVSVYKDELQLSAYTQVATLEGGTITQSANYQGPLLPVDRQARVSGSVLDEPCNELGMSCGDEWGHSADAQASTGSNSLHLFTYSLFYPSASFPPPSTLPVWDGVTAPIQESIADLSWVFRIDQNLTVDFYFVKNSGTGYTTGLLMDKTTNTTLLDFSGTVGFEHVEDLALIAGHKYILQASAADFNHDDDTEAYVDIYFSEDVTFASVPEPMTLLLFSAGLLSIGLGGTRTGKTA